MSESLWPTMQEAFQAIGPHYQEVSQATVQNAGFERGDWFACYLAFGLEPEPLTAVTFHQIAPYGNVERLQTFLIGATERGFLEAVDDYEYALTEKGRSATQQFFDEVWSILAQVTPLSEARMTQLAELLHRIVLATMATAEPAAKPQLAVSRGTDPGLDVPSIVRIDQYLTDLTRFRDDAHVAAWSQYDMNGQTWETFSLIWRGEVNTLAELTERLQNREFDTAVYADALNNLLQKGWISEDEGIYQVTAVGKELRENAEAQTETYFHVGLSNLTENEIATLKSLLVQLKEGLAIAEPELVPA
ncbi:MAG: hypothetical protein GY796_30750 [Chloroflexi bacterium]|nr:hypothetical protein [Chloroflexota bacterium]